MIGKALFAMAEDSQMSIATDSHSNSQRELCIVSHRKRFASLRLVSIAKAKYRVVIRSKSKAQTREERQKLGPALSGKAKALFESQWYATAKSSAGTQRL